jgi:hypothetical protein
VAATLATSATTNASAIAAIAIDQDLFMNDLAG